MKNQACNFLELFIWIKSTSSLFPWSSLDVSVIMSEEEWMCLKCDGAEYFTFQFLLLQFFVQKHEI